MRKNKYILLLFLIPLFAFNAHKYYLSLTQIEYKSDTESIQIILNIFIDDMETALNDIHNIDLQLDTKKELKESDTYFKEYLKKNLHLKTKSKELTFNYLGKEYEGDNIFFYLEIEGVKSLESLEISSSILIEHFPKQQNLIKAKANGVNRSKLLTKKNDKALLKF
ncbi:hypothetical protein RQM59_06645 [Flavobacteriaceae bacterium S356]|uniref:Peptidase E n=1 Tax=Asprobacillus argus TaxID=3076534 RepID=A0ABU3LFJ9_9FLAO|nr:hypothetical protein [Flavobacteriaceae bacterium S356]